MLFPMAVRCTEVQYAQPFNVLFYSYTCDGKGPYRYPSEKKRSPVLKDCLFVNMIILGCKAVDIQKVIRWDT